MASEHAIIVEHRSPAHANVTTPALTIGSGVYEITKRRVVFECRLVVAPFLVISRLVGDLQPSQSTETVAVKWEPHTAGPAPRFDEAELFIGFPKPIVRRPGVIAKSVFYFLRALTCPLSHRSRCRQDSHMLGCFDRPEPGLLGLAPSATRPICGASDTHGGCVRPRAIGQDRRPPDRGRRDE